MDFSAESIKETAQKTAFDLSKKPTAILVAIAIAVTSLIGTGFYLATKNTEERAQPTSVRVEASKARRGSLVRQLTVVGTLESANSVVMKAQVKGLITRVNIIGGEAVRRGDILFEIDDRTYKAQAKEAEALYNLAKSSFEREEKLAEKKFGAIKKFEEARAQYLKTQAQFERAQKDLADTKIIAPFDGFVGLHRISVGTPISADLDLVTITDTDPMKVNFKMPSKFVRYLSVDQRVNIDVDSYPGEKFEGRIEAIDALVDSGAQSIAVQATINNSRNLLKPGMFVRVKVTVGSKDNSLIVPEESIVAVGDQTYVWKIIEHPEHPGLYLTFRVEVLTGIQEKDRIEIMRNLNDGDLVISVGYQKVANGTPVSFDLDSVGLGSEEEMIEDPMDEKKEGATSALTEKKSDTSSFWSRIKGVFSSSDSEKIKESVPKEDSTKETVTPSADQEEKDLAVRQKDNNRKLAYRAKNPSKKGQHKNLQALLSRN